MATDGCCSSSHAEVTTFSRRKSTLFFPVHLFFKRAHNPIQETLSRFLLFQWPEMGWRPTAEPITGKGNGEAKNPPLKKSETETKSSLLAEKTVKTAFE